MTNTEVLTVEDVAVRARVGLRRVRRAVRSGELRAARINGRGELRFRSEWVNGWLESLAVGGESVAA